MRRRTLLSASLGSLFTGAVGWRGLAPLPPAGAITRGEPATDGQRLYCGADLVFGTTATMQLLHCQPRQAELALADAFHAVKKIDALMSIYSERSQVFQLNRDGFLLKPNPHLLTVLAAARKLSLLTGGAFDITVQPLWQQFSRAAASRGLPAADDMRHARALVNWQHLSVTPQRLLLPQPGMAITLNGLAQGYAADLALAAVRARGVQHALLDTGEFIGLGEKAPHRSWTIGVQNPRHAEALSAVLQMDGRSIATSGDYATWFTADFVHHHIFDPSTGDSPTELASATVVAPSGLLADGLSTAMLVMGQKKALALAARLQKVDVLLVDKQGKSWTTPGLRASLS
jgi:thiamine biosynthesis lipoprotein